MKIKKEFIRDIYGQKKKFEVRNSEDKEGLYGVFMDCQYDCEPKLFYLEYITSLYVSENASDQDIGNQMDDMFKSHNGLTTRDSVDGQTYEGIQKNMNYFRSENMCAIYRGTLLKSYMIPKKLEVVE